MRNLFVTSLVAIAILTLPSTLQAFNAINMTWEADSDPTTRDGWWIREPTTGYYDDHWDKNEPGQLNVEFDINVPSSSETWFGSGPWWESGGGFSANEGSSTEQYWHANIQLETKAWRPFGKHWEREFEWYPADPGDGSSMDMWQLALGTEDKIVLNHGRDADGALRASVDLAVENSTGMHWYGVEVDTLNHLVRVYFDNTLIGDPNGYNSEHDGLQTGIMYDTLRWKSYNATQEYAAWDFETLKFGDGRIPEPATGCLLALGGACMLLRRKR